MPTPIRLYYKVDGVPELQRAARRAGAEADDLRDVWERGGSIIAKSAEIPVLTGRMRSTLRVRATKQAAEISVGGRSSLAPHASQVHYGTPAYGREANPFLLRAKENKEDEIADEVEKGFERILRGTDLL